MKLDYWKKVTIEAIDKTVPTRQKEDISIYDWIDDLNYMIKVIHEVNQTERELFPMSYD